jgi:hypothetical protein
MPWLVGRADAPSFGGNLRSLEECPVSNPTLADAVSRLSAYCACGRSRSGRFCSSGYRARLQHGRWAGEVASLARWARRRRAAKRHGPNSVQVRKEAVASYRVTRTCSAAWSREWAPYRHERANGEDDESGFCDIGRPVVAQWSESAGGSWRWIVPPETLARWRGAVGCAGQQGVGEGQRRRCCCQPAVLLMPRRAVGQVHRWTVHLQLLARARSRQAGTYELAAARKAVGMKDRPKGKVLACGAARCAVARRPTPHPSATLTHTRLHLARTPSPSRGEWQARSVRTGIGAALGCCCPGVLNSPGTRSGASSRAA